jgi:hypothetical protein
MASGSTAQVFYHSRAIGTERNVLLVIADHDGHGGAWPSIREISRMCGGVDERRIRRIIRKLEEAGELAVHRSAGGFPNTPDWRRPNWYEITIKCPQWCDRSARHRDLRVLDQELPTPGRETPSPPGRETPSPPGRETPSQGVGGPPELSLELPKELPNELED